MRDDVQYYRSLYNLEQVEILRGPNALLFGRGGTGGIINHEDIDSKYSDNKQSSIDNFYATGYAVSYTHLTLPTNLCV